MRRFADLAEMQGAVPADTASSGWSHVETVLAVRGVVSSIVADKIPGLLYVIIQRDGKHPHPYGLRLSPESGVAIGDRLGMVQILCHGSPEGEEITSAITFYALLDA